MNLRIATAAIMLSALLAPNGSVLQAATVYDFACRATSSRPTSTATAWLTAATFNHSWDCSWVRNFC